MDITWKETRFLRVPLTDEEVQARGEQLAKELKALRDLEDEHAEEKKAMKEAEAAQETAVHRLAGIIRERSEERSVSVELRYRRSLNLLEEIRVDTGELLKSGEATREDQQRASLHAQTSLLREDAEIPVPSHAAQCALIVKGDACSCRPAAPGAGRREET